MCLGGGGKIQTIVVSFGKFIKTLITCNSIKTKWFSLYFLYSEKIYDNKHVR